MLVKDGFGATDGVAVGEIDDQSQIVSSMGKLTLVESHSHGYKKSESSNCRNSPVSNGVMEYLSLEML